MFTRHGTQFLKKNVNGNNILLTLPKGCSSHQERYEVLLNSLGGDVYYKEPEMSYFPSHNIGEQGVFSLCGYKLKATSNGIQCVPFNEEVCSLFKGTLAYVISLMEYEENLKAYGFKDSKTLNPSYISYDENKEETQDEKFNISITPIVLAVTTVSLICSLEVFRDTITSIREPMTIYEQKQFIRDDLQNRNQQLPIE